MQNVLGGDRFLADAALSEGDILRNAAVQMMSYHHHVEGFFRRIHGVGSRWSCGRRNDVRLTAHLDDVWGMPATSPFGVKGVNGSALESRDGIFDEAAFVQRVSVDENLDIHVIGNSKAAIDRGRSCAPILVKLQAACPRFDLLDETRREARIAFAEEAEINWKGVRSLEHPLNVPGSWCARRGIGTNRRSCPAAQHCREARIKRFLNLL